MKCQKKGCELPISVKMKPNKEYTDVDITYACKNDHKMRKRDVLRKDTSLPFDIYDLEIFFQNMIDEIE